MAARFYSKTNPGVVNGVVQKKNHNGLTPNIWYQNPEFTIEKRKPGKNFRHLLKKRDIERFIDLISGWQKLSVGLSGVVLSPGSKRVWGVYYNSGVIFLNAWNRDLWLDLSPWAFKRDEVFLNWLGVPCTLEGDCEEEMFYQCKFDEDTAKCFQLLSVFLHELGHHFDRISSRNITRCHRGEDYAEDWGVMMREKMLDDFVRVFSI